jgi:hypothetical protein
MSRERRTRLHRLYVHLHPGPQSFCLLQKQKGKQTHRSKQLVYIYRIVEKKAAELRKRARTSFSGRPENFDDRDHKKISKPNQIDSRI